MQGGGARLGLWLKLYLAAVAVWVLAIYSLIPDKLRSSQLLVSQTAAQTVSIADFVHFYEAGKLAADDGTRLRVYDPEVQRAWLDQFLAPARTDSVFYMQYVPFVFPLMIPLSWLTPVPAYLSWTAASLLSLLAVAWLSVRGFKLPAPDAVALLVLLLGALPCWNSFVIGQLAGILSLILAVYLWAIAARRDVLAGAMLALSSLKPHYALFFAIPALVQRRWLIIAAAAIVEVLLLALAGVTIGWSNIINYPAILAHSETAAEFGGLNPAKEACLRALFSLLLPESQAFAASIIAWLIGLGLVVRMWLRAVTVESRRWCVAAMTVVCLLVSPHTHLYDWLLLAPAAFVTFDTACLKQSGPIGMWQRLLLLYPLLSWALFLLAGASKVENLSTFLLMGVHTSMFSAAWRSYRQVVQATAAGAAGQTPPSVEAI